MNLYKLQDYLDILQKEGWLEGIIPEGPFLDRPVELVSCDSQETVPGTLFICKGAHFKAQYLQDAADKGAFFYVSEKDYPEVSLPHVLVNDLRAAMSRMASFYYNEPWKKLHVTGVTGTKGKSSTTYYIKSILDQYASENGKPETAIIGGIDTYDGKERFEAHLTTPEPLELERHFAHAVESGIEYATMEVSSQALKYDRVRDVEFSTAVFLNIGYDHISPIEHPNWEDYFQSKLKIFEHCRRGIVNLDSDEADRILEAAKQAPEVITFSEKDPSADVYGYDIRKSDGDTVFRVRTKRFDRQFRLGMPGLFNVPNALAAIAVCMAYGIPDRDMYTGLLKARVPGRMEVYTNASHFITAIVDYAHNRLSFEKLFQSVKSEYPGKRIVIVFGCPGKKALDRRHDLGTIAGKYADHVYITEEDPGEEDAESIAQEIAVAVKAQGCPYSIDTDRGSAIRTAVMDCKEETVILITGKGAETREKRGLEYIPVPSDVEYAKDALYEYDVAHHLDGITQVLGLLDTLPRLQSYAGKILVVKYGGSALEGEGEDAVDTILEDVAALKMAGAKVVLVHGGGKNITRWLDRMGIESKFSSDGYRITDKTTMDVAEMALSGQMNKRIVSQLHCLKVNAVGISGRDGNLLAAKKKTTESGEDLGKVGEVTSVDPSLVLTLLDAGYVPVISPVAMAGDGSAYNINADDAACAIAKALKAEKLVYLTDVDGILMDQKNEKTLLQRLTVSYAQELLDAGMMSGGMVPKLNSCLDAIRAGVSRVVILDARVQHTILLEAVSRQMMGTVIEPDPEEK